MSERDERWQARQDALALEELVEEADPGFEPRDEPQWCEELDFYASLAEHAMRDAVPGSNDEALIEAALAAVPPAAGASRAARFGLVAGAVAVAVVALLWAAWPQETLLRGVERSWTTEAQDILEAMSRGHVQAETPHAKSQPVRDVEPVSPSEPEPKVDIDPKGAAHSVQARRSQSRPRANAATLVATARAARGDGRLADAERSYGELLRRFPKSAEARVGRVALAQIKLGRGKAKAALRLFATAATDGGPLAEEAAWGRIQALHRLGRKNGLRKAVETFVRDYPRSVYRARAQGRLDP